MSVEVLESLVYARKHEEAARYLRTFLGQLNRGMEFGSPEADPEGQRKIYSRLATAIAALLADPAFKVSGEEFSHFVPQHRTLDAIFQASIFRNSDHLLRQFGMLGAADRRTLSFEQRNITKLLLSYSLNSDLDLPFERLFDIAPVLAVPFVLGLLSQVVVMSEAAHNRREQVLGLGPLLEGASMTSRLIDSVGDAYMHCSYASSPRKHEVKRALSGMLRRFIESSIQMPTFESPRRLKERPTIVVPLEAFGSTHAMYRCYASSLAALRNRFRLVAIARTGAADATSRALFDDVVDLGTATVAIDEVVRRVLALSPDLVYFPSIGMDPFCVALASIRLAPIQLLTLGHPATTNSAAMDYVLSTELGAGSPECFSETSVLVSGLPAMIMRADARFPEHEVRAAPDGLRIAISAMGAKVSAPFLRACRRISARASRPVEFYFFTGLAGVYWFQAHEIIREWLPGAVVYRGMGYKDYLDRMNACDLHFSTFPFGGTNTNIDSMKLGIPMITLESEEAHGRSDAAMMRIAGVPEWLIAHSVSEYEDAALRLILEHKTRCDVAHKLLRTDVTSAFMEHSGRGYTQDFAEAVWWLYTMHEDVQLTGKRHWTVEERKRHAGAKRLGTGLGQTAADRP
jgi:hypothetical protein